MRLFPKLKDGREGTGRAVAFDTRHRNAIAPPYADVASTPLSKATPVIATAVDESAIVCTRRLSATECFRTVEVEVRLQPVQPALAAEA